jgi:hypothetical protein
MALAAGLIAPAARAGTPQPLPTPFPEARYRQMSARSPFAVATAAAAPTAAPTPGFAAQLYVDGMAHVGKTDFVAIKSRDQDKAAIFLEVGKSTPDGMKVERVKWSSEMGKSTVDVAKGGEKATLAFDEQQILNNGRQPQPGMPAPPVPILPGQPRPPLLPGQNGQLRHVRMFPPQMPVQPGQ